MWGSHSLAKEGKLGNVFLQAFISIGWLEKLRSCETAEAPFYRKLYVLITLRTTGGKVY